MTSTTKLVIHGTGNAWPEICRGLTCPLCYGADRPLTGRGNTGLSLISKGVHLLIDFGAGTHAGIRRAQLEPPDVVFLTHSHYDHNNEMELNTIIRDAQIASRPQPVFVATERTWQDISTFHQHRLQFTPVTVEKELTLDVAGQHVNIVAIDAADHWRGGVNFIITFGGVRFGALFDRKTWNGMTAAAESLDIAVLEANSLYPMAEKTGHVSLPETLTLLRSLRRAPRLSLLTHIGHDDAAQLSMGSLAALTHSLWPGGAVNWAYPGMTIDTAFLPPRNPVSVLDETTNAVVSVAEKSLAHETGQLHASVLLLPRTHDGRVVLYRRGESQSYPGCLDLFGGHVQPADVSLLDAAQREGAEEIHLTKANCRVNLDPSWIVPLSGAFALESMEARNRERATLFGVSLPEGVEVAAAADEDDAGVPVRGALVFMRIDEFLSLDTQTPNQLADGLRRTLVALADDDLRRRVDEFLKTE